MIGSTLGPYRIVEQVGLGGMAVVYKAYDPGMDRFVALKILPEYYSQDPTFRERFEIEAKAIARLEHLHILPVFAYGEENGISYLVMRYMQAGTLADSLLDTALTIKEISRLLQQVTGALDYAHANGVLHRDVKPSNILLDNEGNAYLTDFGIAKIVEGVEDVTGTALVGTPPYMSPEQCRGEKILTPASDQYSLGVVLYELLTGQRPYRAETPMAVVLMHLNAPLPSLRRLRPDLPEEIEAVVYKALAKQPDQRFKTCTELAETFAKHATGLSNQTALRPSDTLPLMLAPAASQATTQRESGSARVTALAFAAAMIVSVVLGVISLPLLGLPLVLQLLVGAGYVLLARLGGDSGSTGRHILGAAAASFIGQTIGSSAGFIFFTIPYLDKATVTTSGAYVALGCLMCGAPGALLSVLGAYLTSTYRFVSRKKSD